MKLFFILLLAFPFSCTQLFGQMTITSSLTPVDLVEEILLGEGLQVSNISYTGYQYAVGRFEMANPGQFDFNDGIVLCNGTVLEEDTSLFSIGDDPAGPNDIDFAGTDNMMPGDPDLTQLANVFGDSSQNAAILEFDFVAASDTIQLQYIFGSEEYPVFVGVGYNDVFGVFLSGPGISGPYSNNAENIAVLPNGDAVGVNTINVDTNSHLYFDNTGGLYVQYNAYTLPLSFVKKIIKGQKYHIKFAIADMADGSYDSGIFIKAKSLESTGEVVETFALGIPNIVSYNGDGINEKFLLKNLEHFPNTEVRVFNRWGKEIFTSTAYKNEWPQEKFSNGTYFYIIDNHVDEPKHGFVQLMGN